MTEPTTKETKPMTTQPPQQEHWPNTTPQISASGLNDADHFRLERLGRVLKAVPPEVRAGCLAIHDEKGTLYVKLKHPNILWFDKIDEIWANEDEHTVVIFDQNNRLTYDTLNQNGVVIPKETFTT
ncbi:hypothetical protein [Shimia thalassica]|uniref:hypothetical protein n=1 Tax=Shimia thalassica TaxID=1715693 RepID=UPI0026E27C79|nr:hypothetical protein [Shimia thalassica]MDO6479127.1 hypothetical protein [Shimia thalassica]